MGENILRVFQICVEEDIRLLLDSVIPDTTDLDKSEILKSTSVGNEPTGDCWKEKERGSRKFLLDIISKIKWPITIFHESKYVDSTYRDTYYRYYSSQHFEISRDCSRLSIFSSKYEATDVMGGKSEEQKSKLQRDFIGIIVVRPIGIERIGKVLLDPSKLMLDKMYVRKTKFSVEVLGNILEIEAFPFMKQDLEFMTCAEVTLWMVFQYYGTRYPEYRTVLPSEMINVLDKIRSDRILPSKGMHVSDKASILKQFGFQPLIFEKKNNDEFKNMMHYYVESGIPILLSQERHAIICIGHAEPDWNTKKVKIISKTYTVDSSEFYQKYIVMDDGKLPYEVLNYSGYSLIDINPQSLVVPLYRRINLNALTAKKIFTTLIEQTLVEKVIKSEDFSAENPLVYRIQLTTSRKYQSFRSDHEKQGSDIYLLTTYPKFIWLCEISSKELYKNGKIMGEIVVDATTNRLNASDSIILFRYKNMIVYQNEKTDEYGKKLQDPNCIVGSDVPYYMYINNLEKV